MEDILKRLLDTESQAEAIVEQAKAEASQRVDQAVADSQAAERAFIDSIPALHDNAQQKAKQRAAQTLSELERRYRERSEQLRQQGERHHDAALQAALAIMLRIED